MPSPWTDELDQILRDNWPTMSSPDLVRLLASQGYAFTRNAVVGRGTRLGLKKPRKEKNPLLAVNVVNKVVRHRGRVRLPAPRGSIAPSSFVPRIVDCAPRHLTIFELTEATCKYECTDAAHPADYRFCGHPVARGCYCARHAALVFVGSTPARIKPARARAAA